MSQDVMEFANNWVSENINAEVYDPDQRIIDAHVAKLIADAKTAGISQTDLEDEFGELSDFIADEIEAATDDEVYGLADEDD